MTTLYQNVVFALFYVCLQFPAAVNECYIVATATIRFVYVYRLYVFHVLWIILKARIYLQEGT